MTSTFTDYRILSSDISQSLSNKAKNPEAKREIQYFRDNIGKVKTIDDFLGNNRLYKFAMKAYGLDDMISAKGFMRKVLMGESDANGRVLVDRLQDQRYKDFANAFNFKSFGVTSGNLPISADADIQALYDSVALQKKSVLQQRFEYDDETERDIDYIRIKFGSVESLTDIESDYKFSSIVRQTVGLASAKIDDDPSERAGQLEGKVDLESFQDPEKLNAFIDQFLAARTAGRKAIVEPYSRQAGTYAASDAEMDRVTRYFTAKVNTVYSAADIVADPVLADVVRTTLGLPSDASAKPEAQAQQIARKLDVATLQNPKTLSAFVDRFKTARGAAVDATINAYLRQTLEVDAGNENQGVRLALYFRRMAPGVKSAYGLLADPALAQVVRTALALPTEAAKISVEGQAKLIERKLSVADLKDPDKLERFIKRFTILWDTQNSAGSSPAAAIIGGGASLDSDVLLKLQNIRGGF